ncbi:MAG TPA: glycoside hydrolase family 28 protein [Chthoniobacterales bacterium]|nr:glycoside hydrolase family 28 protein [Chthoniobacterales bacterium]
MTRRELLRASFTLPLSVAIRGQSDASGAAETVLSRIKPPSFPARDFDITRFGATPGGQAICTDAIRKAIAACSAAGGGRVLIPRGSFLTGAIHLESNINLHVSDGAVLLFSRDPKDCLPLVYTRFEGTECMNYSPFIYAFQKENIAVTGPGLLDGQADAEHWWPWARKARGGARGMQRAADSDVETLVRKMGDHDVPVGNRVFGEGHYLRPNFVQPYRCNNVLLEGFTMKNSPMWELNPVLCRNVTVRNVNIDSHGPNNDGCDPESSRDVLISGCSFSTGDDCIAIKSGRNRDGRRVNVPCENVIVRDCTMKDGHGGVSIGSEVSGGIRNIFVDACRMSSPNLQRALRIKTNSYRGGVIEGIHFTSVTVGQVAQAVIEVDFYYEEGEGGPFRPVVKDIFVGDVTCQKSKYGIYLRGYAQDPITGVDLANCTFDNAAQGDFFQNVSAVKAKNVKVNGKLVTAKDLESV